MAKCLTHNQEYDVIKGEFCFKCKGEEKDMLIDPLKQPYRLIVDYDHMFCTCSKCHPYNVIITSTTN